MALTDNVVRWYDERKRAENPAQWAQENEKEAACLTTAYRLAKEYGLLKD
jgi:hypothetical protein